MRFVKTLIHARPPLPNSRSPSMGSFGNPHTSSANCSQLKNLKNTPMKPSSFYKRILLIISLLSGALWSPSMAADAPSPAHWYRIVITCGDSPLAFTGSSPLDANQLSARLSGLNGTETMTLENLRERNVDPNEPTPELKWRPSEEGSKLFFPARAVIYFVSLPGDPITKPK